LIKEFLKDYHPDEILENIAQTGLVFKFNGQKNKPSLMFRADLDALPIEEKQNKDYVSKKNVSLICVGMMGIWRLFVL
jgi:metal-dependent amidase/aminoacylase/carboxypeptidase family protein